MIEQLKNLPIVSIKSRAYIALDEAIAIVEAVANGNSQDQNAAEVERQPDEKPDAASGGTSGRGNRQSHNRGGPGPT